MHHLFALFLTLLEAPASLSPAAAGHNTRAMHHYDSGQLASAVDEFHAAYQAMPDARRDRAGRELLLGSMRATLLELHQQTGTAAPLCRLQKLLQDHVDALTAAFPEDPEMLETRSVRARHDEVTQQLTKLGPGACEPPPPPPPAVIATPAPASPAPPTPPLAAPPPDPDAIPPRHLSIAGGVTLGLGTALLGVMTYGLVTEAQQRTRAAEIRDHDPDCPLTAGELAELQDLRTDAKTGRGIAIGAGIAAGVAMALGGTLVGMAYRSPAKKRWSAAPWWSPAGAGLTVRVQFGPR
jgi:hypothetical protein